MAFTEVFAIVKGAQFDAAKYLSQDDVEVMLSQIHDALNGVANLTFTSIVPQISRNDDTAGS